MKGKRKKQRRRLMKPVVVGFAAIYLVIMLLSTYLVKVQFENDYDDTLKETLSNIQRRTYDQEYEPPELWDNTAKQVWYQSITNDYLYPSEEFMKLSFAVYDEEGELLAKSENIIGTFMIPMDEVFSQEDKETLAGYLGKNTELYDKLEPPKYEILARGGGDEPYEIAIWELVWKKEEDLEKGDSYVHIYNMSPYTDYFGEIYYPDIENPPLVWYETDRKLVWNRTIEEIGMDYLPEFSYANVCLPYINLGYKNWEQWDKSAFLHYFPDKTDLSEWEYGSPAAGSSSRLFCKSTVVCLAPDPESDFNRYIEAHMESYPWLAAMDYMKYLYLAGFVLMIACMVKIIYSANKLYDQQEALEETRRDFINAIAHELKTPLGVIRNFAENLLEHNMEEKREYYLTQIVGQTEEMDRLAGEMIFISRMDSEKLVPGRESLSLWDLIEEQLTRLKPLIEEKQIQVDIQKEQDFQVEGDRDYLSRAIWNLLTNAIDYNVPEGSIVIYLNERTCTIENTGAPLSEEQLEHGFDLFYSQDKSRSSRDGKHMGLGLYLAKKILDKHGLKITLENTMTGVQVVISGES